MATRNTFHTEIVGRDVTFDYSENWVGYSLFSLRVVMGWVLFQGGVTKRVTSLEPIPRTTELRRASRSTPSPRATP